MLFFILASSDFSNEGYGYHRMQYQLESVVDLWFLQGVNFNEYNEYYIIWMNIMIS